MATKHKNVVYILLNISYIRYIKISKFLFSDRVKNHKSWWLYVFHNDSAEDYLVNNRTISPFSCDIFM